MRNYLERIGACKTVNEVNRKHIYFDSVLCPLEIAGIANLPGLPKQSREWLEGLGKLNGSLFEAPSPHFRSRIDENIVRYKNPRSPPKNKILIVGFTGMANRLMMPLPIFLQTIPTPDFDLLLVRRKRGQSFMGIPGGPRSLMERVFSAAYAKRYRRIVTIGTSAGGYMALVAAGMFAADRGLSIGGRLPEQGHEPAVFGSPLRPEVKAPTLVAAASEHHELDMANAQDLAQTLGCAVVPIPDQTSHNSLHRLLLSRQCAEFLGRSLIGEFCPSAST